MTKPSRYELEAAEEVKAFVNDQQIVSARQIVAREKTKRANTLKENGGFPVGHVYGRIEWIADQPTTKERQLSTPDLPPRRIPDGGLKPKKRQSEKPTLLERYQEEVSQRKLF